MTADKTDNERWILVVEDDPDIRETLQLVLEGWDYVVRIAADGREALEAMHQGKPSMVLTDLHMPVMSGTELLLDMRRDPRLSDIPVLVVTAWKADAEAIGAQDLVTKPVNVDRLLASVRKYCD